MSTTKRTKPKQPEGLIGLFGHFWIDDPKDTGERMIQFVFQIIRKMEGERYVVQYYDWFGDRSAVGVHPETELLGPDVRLYADGEVWFSVFEEESKNYWRRHEIKREKEREDVS